MEDEIKIGDIVVTVIYPHIDRIGEVTCIVEYDGVVHFNVWLFDVNEILGFEKDEIMLLSSYHDNYA